MSNSFKVNVSPSMGVYRHYQNYPYSIQTALSEFIDNSIQSYIDNQVPISTIDKKNNALRVKVSIKTKTKEISIIDNAGGINRKNFRKAIKLGPDTNYPETSLSKFGLGMKTAATWFSSIWRIETSALNSTDKLTSEFNLNELEKRKETKISVFINAEKEKNHYTKITIKDSPRIETKQYYEETVVPHLLETFIKFKDFLSIEVKYNDETLKGKKRGKFKTVYFEAPNPLEYPILGKDRKIIKGTNREWVRRIELNYQGHKKVKGKFIIMKGGSYYQPGIRLFRNRRVIEGTVVKPNRPEIIFKTGVNKYSGLRLYGELHLTDFELDFMKTKFIGLDSLYSKLKVELQKDPNFINQLNRLRKEDLSSEIPDSEKTNAPFQEESETNIITRKPSGKVTRKTINRGRIEKSESICSKLLDLKNKKLYHLYNSLCVISLNEHPYLAYIGSSAFLEGLSVIMGNDIDKQSFDAFYGNKLNSWEEYKDERKIKKRIRNAIKEIHSKGNFSKHDFDYEFSDARQLHNEFKVLEEFVIKCIDDIQDS